MGDKVAQSKQHALRSRAVALQSQGQWEAAAQAWVALWRVNPDDDEVLDSAATGLIRAGQVEPAMAFLEAALALRGARPAVLQTLARVATELRLPEVAVEVAGLWAQQQPDRPEPFVALARALGDAHRHDEAVGVLQQAIPQHPGSVPLWTVLGTLVSERDGFEAALPFFVEAQRLAPQRASVWSNLGRALEHLGRNAEAIEASEQAVALDPDNPVLRMGLGLLRLGQGQLDTGWSDYAARLDPRMPGQVQYDFDGAPVPSTWSGGEVAGEALLVVAEQGLGDEVLFGRALGPLAERVGSLTVAVDPRLVPAFVRSLPTARVVPHETLRTGSAVRRRFPSLADGPRPSRLATLGAVAADAWASVAGVERCGGAYLRPDPSQLARWSEALVGLGEGLKVGIAWRSGLLTPNRAHHYASLQDFVPVLAAEGVVGINVQYGDCSDDLARLAARDPSLLHHFGALDLRDDIEGVLGLLASLDLVISPLSSTAQLAAAVGTPCWMFGYVRPWWMFGEDRVPWAPNARVYTVDGGSDWSPAVLAMTQDLRDGALGEGAWRDLRGTCGATDEA